MKYKYLFRTMKIDAGRCIWVYYQKINNKDYKFTPNIKQATKFNSKKRAMGTAAPFMKLTFIHIDKIINDEK